MSALAVLWSMALSAFGRHLQGGVTHGRIWACALCYPLALAPLAWIYGSAITTQSSLWALVISVELCFLVGLFYLNELISQNFASLWGGTLRYCGVFFMLSGIVGSIWPAMFGIPAFFVLWWARQRHESTPDPHQAFEWAIGACAGGAWTLAAIMRAW